MNLIEKRKIKQLRKKIEESKVNAHKEGRFSLFDTDFSNKIFNQNDNYKTLEDFYEIISGLEEHCKLPYEVGIELDNLAKEKTVMIHRTELGIDKDELGLEYNNILESIMNEGLKNYGHINSSGATVNSLPNLTLTMTPLTGLTGYINLLGSYHSNDAVIIAAFPKELVDKNGDFTDKGNHSEIYDLSEEIPKVKPEYIIGAILKKNKSIDEFYTREDILNVSKETKTL